MTRPLPKTLTRHGINKVVSNAEAGGGVVLRRGALMLFFGDELRARLLTPAGQATRCRGNKS